MISKFIKLVETYDKIILFRHVDGDGDALGSQWGLYNYIKETYPDKTVYAVGDITLGYKDLFPNPETLDDNEFKDSLAIVLDTANSERISDQRYELCSEVIKIDHHLPIEPYGVLNIENDKRSSCGEIVTDILREIEKGKPLSPNVARNLFLAIISDTQGFSISSVTSETFDSASYLLQSNINPSALSDELRQMDLELFQFQATLYQHIKYIDKRIAYLTITQEMIKNAGLSVSEVKLFVGLMRNIKGIEIWVLFIEQEDLSYSASLRSKEIDINQVARLFNGGGHLNASGVKNLTLETKEDLLRELQKL